MPRKYDPEQIERLDGDALAKALLDAEIAVARTEARLQAQLEFAARDPAISDAVRVAAWAKIGRVTAEQPEGGGEPILRAPEGWPEGMDPASALATFLGEGTADE